MDTIWVVLGSFRAHIMIFILLLDGSFRWAELPAAAAFLVVNVVLDIWDIALAGQRAGFSCGCQSALDAGG